MQEKQEEWPRRPQSDGSRLTPVGGDRAGTPGGWHGSAD